MPGLFFFNKRARPGSHYFSYSGNSQGATLQSFIVPYGIRWLAVTIAGAQGGAGRASNAGGPALSSGGGGGQISCDIPVRPLETLFILIGYKGAPFGGAGGGIGFISADTSVTGGGNGGGGSFLWRNIGSGGPIPGTSAAKTAGPGSTGNYNQYLVVSGGGGGAGSGAANQYVNNGGAGGGLTGGTGVKATIVSGPNTYTGGGATGGTQSAGGAPGGAGASGLSGGTITTDTGGFTVGASASGQQGFACGAGGGGYYGGGAGDNHVALGFNAGGGGSDYAINTALGVTILPGMTFGNGYMQISW